jgi:hypothetical protein
LRRIINANSKTGLTASSFQLTAIEERFTGTDAAIVILRGGSSKVLLFEAKWPRFSSVGYKWDSIQPGTGESHFSNQIDRQTNFYPKYAIFEMFYCEYPLKSPSQPIFMESEGSSCVWHSDTFDFCKTRSNPGAIWTQSDLKLLLTNKKKALSDIIAEVTQCSKGLVLPISDPFVLRREYGLPNHILTISAAGG